MTDYTTLLSALKDVDSNVRSEISYLDRNVTNGVNTGVSNVISNSASLAAQGREQLNRTSDYLVSDSHRTVDTLSSTLERQNMFAQNLNNGHFKDIKDVAHRNSDFILNDTRRNSDFLSNSIERNGTATNLAMHNSQIDLAAAIERNSVASNLNTFNTARDTMGAVERNGVQNSLTTERAGSTNLAETIRNAGQIRDLINMQSAENRNAIQFLSSQTSQHSKESALAAKETDLRVAESAFRTQQQTAAVTNDMGRMKSDLERQAAENSAMAARDMAALSRDVLLSKGELMKTISDSTGLLQIEALKNKECLSHQIHNSYDKLVGLNTERIRDNLNDFRAENVGLKYGDWFNRHEIHNNLYSNHGGFGGFPGGFPGGPGGFPGGPGGFPGGPGGPGPR
jgi:hypothetical protein